MQICKGNIANQPFKAMQEIKNSTMVLRQKPMICCTILETRRFKKNKKDIC